VVPGKRERKGNRAPPKNARKKKNYHKKGRVLTQDEAKLGGSEILHGVDGGVFEKTKVSEGW